ncbi:MAG: LysR family transcriptional regulator [Granulosicoccus sp.]|nr:LysR family transcriptional regulator [Granulosicoccus sp.]
MKLDPKHLAQLSAIAEAGSFQAAADQLGLTQPALSRNMRALEARLGSTLFKREGRRSTPNMLGLRLARAGLTIRLAEEQAIIAADQSARGTTGELRIGAPPIVAGRFITEPLADFIRAYPSCTVELRTGLVDELRTLLERGQIDLVLGPQGLVTRANDLEFQHLIDDRVGILCRAGHELTQRKKIRPTDLKTQTWLAHSRGSLLRQQTEAAMLACGVSQMNIGLETDSIRTVLEVVATTDLITSMPKATTQPYLEDRLTFLKFDRPQFHRPLGVIRRKSTPASKIEEQFLELLSSGL